MRIRGPRTVTEHWAVAYGHGCCRRSSGDGSPTLFAGARMHPPGQWGRTVNRMRAHGCARGSEGEGSPSCSGSKDALADPCGDGPPCRTRVQGCSRETVKATERRTDGRRRMEASVGNTGKGLPRTYAGAWRRLRDGRAKDRPKKYAGARMHPRCHAAKDCQSGSGRKDVPAGSSGSVSAGLQTGAEMPRRPNGEQSPSRLREQGRTRRVV